MVILCQSATSEIQTSILLLFLSLWLAFDLYLLVLI